MIFVNQERPRPEYAAKAPTYEENPITRVKEPYFPPRKRLPRILSGIAVIIVMVGQRVFYFEFYEVNLASNHTYEYISQASSS